MQVRASAQVFLTDPADWITSGLTLKRFTSNLFYRPLLPSRWSGPLPHVTHVVPLAGCVWGRPPTSVHSGGVQRADWVTG